jgi:chaperonin GroES
MGTLYDSLELVGARLLVRPLPDLDTTAGGIVIPEQSRHEQNRAIVEKIGPGELLDTRLREFVDYSQPFDVTPLVSARRPVAVKAGDLVLYQKYAGTWVTLDGIQRLMLLEDEVQAFMRVGAFELVTHPDNAREHLQGEPCSICSATSQAASKAWLEQERAALVSGASSPSAS